MSTSAAGIIQGLIVHACGTLAGTKNELNYRI